MNQVIIDRARALECPGLAVIATDAAGVVCYWGRGAESLYGWTAAEALGRDITELTPGEPSREQARDIMSRLSQGLSWCGEFLVRRRDGTPFIAEVNDTPVYGDNGRLVGVIGTSHHARPVRPTADAPLIRGSS